LRFRQLCKAHPISVSYRLKVQPAAGCETNNAQTIVSSGVAGGSGSEQLTPRAPDMADAVEKVADWKVE
jgi:hypothetical protein